MVDKKWTTDEDKMIYHYEAHRDLITWVVKKLNAEGIRCERTTGNNAGGDILYYNPEDEPRVKQIVRELQSKNNQP